MNKAPRQWVLAATIACAGTSVGKAQDILLAPPPFWAAPERTVAPEGPIAFDLSTGRQTRLGDGAVAAWWQRSCHFLRSCFLGFPEEFEAPPLGASVQAFAQAQVANAEAARMVLYRADFVEGVDQLTPRGREQLVKIAALLPTNFCPLVIQHTPCAPGLDAARRQAVLNELGRCAFPVPPERVVVGMPVARGLEGVEAGIVYGNLLIQTQSGGTRGGAGGGSIGGTVGQGFGATGRSGGPGQ